MTATWAAIIGGIVAALVTGAASVLVARLNNNRARSDAITAPYAELAADVVALRKELRTVREDRRTDQHAIEMLQDRVALMADEREDYLAYLRLLLSSWPPPPAPEPPSPPQRLAGALEETPPRVVETTTTTRRVITPEEP